mgnify:CR=1 FL=1
MKVYLQTYGCQANIADSEAILGILKEKNYELTNSEDEADVIIVNTCSVKNATQSKEIHYIREKSKTKKIIVGGCLTKTLDIRKYAPDVTAVFDTNSILKVHEVLKTEQDHFSDKKEDRILKIEDLVEVVKEVIRLNNNPNAKADQVDHLGNRRVRTLSELLQNRLRVGLMRMER